jgi:hypothetical protein
MDKQEFERAQELALVALTSIEYKQDTDRERAATNLGILAKAYPAAEVNEGAMTMLSILVVMDAQALGMSVSQRVAQLREFMRESTHRNDPTGEV